MQEPLQAKLLLFSLYALLIVGVLVTVTMPYMLNFYLLIFYDAYAIKEGYSLFVTCFLMVCGGLGVWMLAEMILMMRSIAKGPFINRNVRALRRIGYIALVLMLLFFLKCLLYITALTLGCIFIFLICALFAFTLAALFEQAIRYKEENDLTI